MKRLSRRSNPTGLRDIDKKRIGISITDVEGKRYFNLTKLVKEFYKDPTSDEDWSVVEIAPFKKLKNPVSLEMIKKDKKLAAMQIIKLSRLSVSAVTADEFNHILNLSETK